MTLLGVESWDVKLVTGPAYKVGPRCANPSCDHWADDAHHIVRRSHLGGKGEDRNWVVVDGVTIANICGLCVPCHRDVTGMTGGHRAAIVLHDNRWWWYVVDPDGNYAIKTTKLRAVGLLDPHPPTLDEAEHASQHDASEPGVCPTCGQARKRRVGASAPARRRKTWVVNVPDDSEDGAEVLDTLIDDLALVLGYDPGPSARYFVLVPALVSAQMNRKRFANEIKGVGE